MNAIKFAVAALALAVFGLGSAYADVGNGAPVTTSSTVEIGLPY